MNELAVKHENAVAISDSTKDLIRAGVSENTLRTYLRALTSLETWLDVELNAAAMALQDVDNSYYHPFEKIILEKILFFKIETGCLGRTEWVENNIESIGFESSFLRQQCALGPRTRSGALTSGHNNPATIPLTTFDKENTQDG